MSSHFSLPGSAGLSLGLASGAPPGQARSPVAGALRQVAAVRAQIESLRPPGQTAASVTVPLRQAQTWINHLEVFVAQLRKLLVPTSPWSLVIRQANNQIGLAELFLQWPINEAVAWRLAGPLSFPVATIQLIVTALRGAEVLLLGALQTP